LSICLDSKRMDYIPRVSIVDVYEPRKTPLVSMRSQRWNQSFRWQESLYFLPFLVSRVCLNFLSLFNKDSI